MLFRGGSLSQGHDGPIRRPAAGSGLRRLSGAAWTPGCIHAGLFILASLLPAHALTGPRLGVHSLVARADAVARVETRFAAAGQPARVRVLSWLMPPRTEPREYAGIHPDNWIGYCLPDRQLLLHWQHSHAHLGALPLWRRAVRENGYESLLFLRWKQGALVPVCESESMLALSWRSHPGYHDYLARVKATIKQSRPPADHRPAR